MIDPLQFNGRTIESRTRLQQICCEAVRIIVVGLVCTVMMAMLFAFFDAASEEPSVLLNSTHGDRTPTVETSGDVGYKTIRYVRGISGAIPSANTLASLPSWSNLRNVVRESSHHTQKLQPFMAYEYGAGFPWVCFRGLQIWEHIPVPGEERPSTESGLAMIDIVNVRIVAPIGLVVPALLANMCAWGLCVRAIAAVLRSILRTYRIITGKCSQCNYMLRGLRRGRCPECGCSTSRTLNIPGHGQ